MNAYQHHATGKHYIEADMDDLVRDGSIWHDLKSPANTVRMLLREARLALGTGDIADADQLLGIAEAQTEAMRRLVEDLLAYTRMAGGDAETTTFDLDAVLADVLESLASEIARSGADIELGSFGPVRGCEWQVRQMLRHLLSDAIRFRPAERTPRIAVRARRDNTGRLTIEVEDNGTCNAPCDQPGIPGLFAEPRRSSALRGSGLAVAVCHRVAAAHGGTFSVRSTSRGGTVFHVTLSS